jgi:NAD(P)-dependent dehydrogenase (short-subunit alcohol dehydrogenase family)
MDRPDAPVVLITGGAGNLGGAVTRAFLRAGWQAFVPLHQTDRRETLDAYNREFGAGRAHGGLLDLTTERGAASAVQQAVEWGGRLDAVAHLMGGWSGGKTIPETPADLFDTMVQINLTSAFLLARAAIPRMVARGQGSLIFVSSRAARERRAKNAAYAVAKAGLIVLAESIAEEYADEGIRANCVLPGTIDTPANRAAMPNADHSAWTRPEEIAQSILFLASPASSAVNGAAIPVYGRS